MNKELSKATMTRNRLRKKFLRKRSAENRENFNKQQKTDDCPFIIGILIKSFGNTSDKSSQLLALWKIENFVF